MLQSNGTGEICPQIPLAPKFCVPDGGKRHGMLTRLRAWKRGWAKGIGPWAKLYRESVGGELYADRLAAGRVRPYALGDVGHALRAVLSRDAVEMLGHLLGAEKAFHARGGLRIAHRTTARILDRSQRHAGDVMRELVASGLVKVRWHFHRFSDNDRPLKDGGGTLKHHERTPVYSTTTRCEGVLARCLHRSVSSLVGKKLQPSGIKPCLTTGPKRRTRPELAFVAQMQKSRGPQREPLPIAKVIERMPDGSIALGSPLTAETVLQRLRRAGVDEDLARVIASSTRSFEEATT